MKFDFWIDLPKCLLDIKKEETTDEESLFAERLENSHQKISALENYSPENKEVMSTLINKIHQRKIQLACEAIKFSISLIVKIDDSMERKIAEEFPKENIGHLNIMIQNLRSDVKANERNYDLLVKIKMFLQIIIVMSKFLTEEIENSEEVQKIYFSKVKIIIDRIISKMYAKSNYLIRNFKIDSENDNSKICKPSECLYLSHKYSVSTVTSERNEDESSIVI